MADALLSAEKLLDNEIIIAGPNDLIDKSAYELLLKDKSKSDVVIVGHKIKSYFPGGYLVVDRNDFLKEIVEKPVPGKEPSDTVNIVLHLHKDIKKFIKYLKTTKSKKDDIYEMTLQRLIKEGSRIKVVKHRGMWHAIKYPWHIFDAMGYFLADVKQTIPKSAKIAETAIIEGNVSIGENVKVFEYAVIKGPCYIGDNSVIGSNVLIWGGTQIGKNCVIGFTSEIKRSYIDDNCWFHQNYIGDSLIMNNCAFGSGTTTANLRFDEKNVADGYALNFLLNMHQVV